MSMGEVDGVCVGLCVMFLSGCQWVCHVTFILGVMVGALARRVLPTLVHFHPRSVYSSNLTIDRRFRISSSDTLHRAHSTDSYHSTSMTRPATRSNLLVLVLLEVERDAVHAVSGISRAAMHPALKTHRSSVGVSNPSPLNTCPRCPPQFAQRI